MSKYWRPLAAVGAILFAVSFFLPPSFHNAPLSQFHVVSEMIGSAVTMGQQMAFVAVAIALCFSYVSAGVSAVTLAIGRSADVWGRWLVFSCYSVGGVAITCLGVTLIILDDPWPAPGVRWYAAIAPAILIGCMGLLAYVNKPEKRLPVMLLVALGMQVPLQFLVMSLVIRYQGPFWGYFMGGVGASWVVISAIFGMLQPPLASIRNDTQTSPR